jgi:hypothetical protein
MQQDRPFRGLASFGNNFLSKFEGAEVREEKRRVCVSVCLCARFREIERDRDREEKG